MIASRPFLKVNGSEEAPVYIEDFPSTSGLVVAQKRFTNGRSPKPMVELIIETSRATQRSDARYAHFVMKKAVLGRFQNAVLAGKNVVITPELLRWEFRGKSYRVSADRATIARIGG